MQVHNLTLETTVVQHGVECKQQAASGGRDGVEGYSRLGVAVGRAVTEASNRLSVGEACQVDATERRLADKGYTHARVQCFHTRAGPSPIRDPGSGGLAPWFRLLRVLVVAKRRRTRRGKVPVQMCEGDV